MPDLRASIRRDGILRAVCWSPNLELCGPSATLLEGVERGGVLFTQEDKAVRVQVAVSGLSEGWHGFHVHTTGNCTVSSALPTDPFGAAGGHLGQPDPQRLRHRTLGRPVADLRDHRDPEHPDR